jgi:arabinofuranosyltransferase
MSSAAAVGARSQTELATHRRPTMISLSSAVTHLSTWAPPVALAFLGWQRRWVAEDAFITLRVVRHLESGHGPVFNIGERVEASTSMLWTMVLAVVHGLLRIRLELVAVGLGIALSAAGLALAGMAARRLWLPGGRAAVPLGALIVLVLPPFWDFTTSGLETGLVFAWLGCSSFLVAGAATAPIEPSRAWPKAVLIGLGPLVRPDLAILAGPLLVALALLSIDRGPHAARRIAAVLGAGMAVPLAYQCFRMGYYGALVPNPGITKEASSSWWAQGGRYLADLANPYHLAIPLAALVAALAAGIATAARSGMALGQWRIVLAAAAPAVGGLFHGLYVVRVGGDFMHGRLLLPSLFALCTPVMLVAPRRRLGWPPAIVVAAWAIILAGALPRPVAGIPASGIADERATWVMLSGRSHPVRVEDYRDTPFWQEGTEARRWYAAGKSGLGIHLAPRPGLLSLPVRDVHLGRVALVAGNVGVVGMAAGVDIRVVDTHGITDALGAHLAPGPHTRIGHEKQLDLAWVWARFVAPGAAPPSGDVTGVPTAEAVADATAALECGALRRLKTATTAQLTPARFIRNMAEAVRLHSFRFPGDPRRARGELCSAR